MKKFNQNFIVRMMFLFLLSGSLVMQTACKKNSDGEKTTPTKFTQLQVDQNFKFSPYIDLSVTINVEQSATISMYVIQLFNGDPSKGGKLIGTGSTDANFQYKTKIRMPSAIKEIYIAKISPDGINKYVSTAITGTSLVYTFTGTKSAGDASLVVACGTGCTQTLAAGTHNNLTIGPGVVVCVPVGVTVTLNTPVLNTGGLIRICGTVHWNNINGNGGTIEITSSGNMNGTYSLTGRTLNNYSSTYVLPNNNFDGVLNNYGTLSVGSGETFQINSSAAIHNYGTMSIPYKFNINGILTNDGPMTIGNKLTINGQGTVSNSCSMTITSSHDFINNNALTNTGYISVCNGEFNCQGGSTVTLGLGSLVRCQTFNLNGNITGPNSLGSQVTAIDHDNKSKITASCNVSGYVDLYASKGLNPNNGHYGSHVTFNLNNTNIPSCNALVPPSITSSLTATALTGSQFTYITTTGESFRSQRSGAASPWSG